jgi:hypothetical protein
MLLGFEIGQKWPEAVMHSCGSYFVLVPKQLLIFDTYADAQHQSQHFLILFG